MAVMVVRHGWQRQRRQRARQMGRSGHAASGAAKAVPSTRTYGCAACVATLGVEGKGLVTAGEAPIWWLTRCPLLAGGLLRYSNEHGLAHFKATKHRFSLQLDSLRVWDYVGDTYVHRLAVTPQHEVQLQRVVGA